MPKRGVFFRNSSVLLLSYFSTDLILLGISMVWIPFLQPMCHAKTECRVLNACKEANGDSHEQKSWESKISYWKHRWGSRRPPPLLSRGICMPALLGLISYNLLVWLHCQKWVFDIKLILVRYGFVWDPFLIQIRQYVINACYDTLA